MFYDLVFLLNLDLEIFNQLGMITIITLFLFLKGFKLILFDELYTS
jgi:hypothetical protein